MTVRSFNRNGAWVIHHPTYQRAAARELWHLRGLSREYAQRYDLLVATSGEPGYAEWVLSSLQEQAAVKAVSVQIYSAMAIEAFLNFYGVVRLGEKLFKKYGERQGITEKLGMLLLFCDGIELDDHDELWKLTRVLFDNRNALVHPKAREFRPEAPLDGDPVSTATSAYRRMRRFFQILPQYAPEVGYKGRPRPGLFEEPSVT